MARDIIQEIFEAFARHGDETYGEGVSQLDHALQCADLAVRDGAENSLVVAALLHDYGHFFEQRGHAAEREGRDARHEAAGAAALRPWFGPEVVEPIALHVAAKRYLCAVEPGYEAGLSPASRLSLGLQGGPFNAEQAARFERAPAAAAAVRLRRYDDQGKTPELVPPPLESYRERLERALLTPVA